MQTYFKHDVKADSIFNDRFMFSSFMGSSKVILTLGDDDIIITNRIYDCKFYARDIALSIDGKAHQVNTADEFISLILETLKNKSESGEELSVNLITRTDYSLYKSNITLKDISVLDKYNIYIPDSDMSQNEQNVLLSIFDLYNMPMEEAYNKDSIINLLNIFNKFKLTADDTTISISKEEQSKLYLNEMIHVIIDGKESSSYDDLQKAYNSISDYVYKNYLLDDEEYGIIPNEPIHVDVLLQYKHNVWRSVLDVNVYNNI